MLSWREDTHLLQPRFLFFKNLIFPRRDSPDNDWTVLAAMVF